jgi:hypothetical protein
VNSWRGRELFLSRIGAQGFDASTPARHNSRSARP